MHSFILFLFDQFSLFSLSLISLTLIWLDWYYLSSYSDNLKNLYCSGLFCLLFLCCLLIFIVLCVCASDKVWRGRIIKTELGPQKKKKTLPVSFSLYVSIYISKYNNINLWTVVSCHVCVTVERLSFPCFVVYTWDDFLVCS